MEFFQMSVEKIHVEQRQREWSRTICILIEKDTNLIETYQKVLLNPGDKVILLNTRSEKETIGFHFPYLQLAGYDHDLQSKMKSLHRHHVVNLMKKAAGMLADDCYVEAYGVLGNKEDLLAKVIELNPNLVVMGREKSFIGSYTKYFVQNCNIPCMIVK
jgi:hypothetical protein